MKVRIEEEFCAGTGTCVEICPQVFELQEDLAVPKMEEVPKEFEEKCKEAAESCPVEAIVIED